MAGTGRPLAVYVLSLSRGGLRVAIGLPEVAPGLTELRAIKKIEKHTLICLSVSFNTLSHSQGGDQGGDQG